MGLLLEIRTTCEGAAETCAFTDFPVRVGRDASSELRLSYPFVSRHHARIERTELGLALIDEGSRNGIVYEGTKIRPRDPVYLRDGARFAIERLVGTFHIQDQTEVQAFEEPTTHDRVTSLYADQLVFPELVSSVAVAMEHYRAAHDAVVEVIAGSLDARPAWHRALVAERLATQYPELALDPGLQKPLAERGVHMNPVPTRGNEASRPPRIVPTLSVRRPDEAPRARTVLPGVDSLLGGLDEARRAGFASELKARVQGVLGELSPAAIERGADGSRWRGPFRSRALWREYTRRHEEVAAALSSPSDKARGDDGVTGTPPLAPRAADGADRAHEPVAAGGDSLLPLAPAARGELA